jgi:hypothetical protein
VFYFLNAAAEKKSGILFSNQFGITYFLSPSNPSPSRHQRAPSSLVEEKKIRWLERRVKDRNGRRQPVLDRAARCQSR